MQIQENNTLDEHSVICNKCHNVILKETIVTCFICKKEILRKVTMVFDKRKYKISENTTLSKGHRHIYKDCHSQLLSKVMCVCCRRDVDKKKCKTYDKVEYDFTQFVASYCLANDVNSENEEEYICMPCDKSLKETSDQNPVLPYYGKYGNVKAGANFLKALQEKPQYVCTCCHHMLFCKNVRQFNLTEYIKTNATVEKSLSDLYVMKLQDDTSDPNDNDNGNTEWPEFSQENVGTKNT